MDGEGEPWVAFLREGEKREDKRRQVVLSNNKRCELRHDRRALAVVAVGYHFGTINKHTSPHPTRLLPSMPFSLQYFPSSEPGPGLIAFDRSEKQIVRFFFVFVFQ